MTAEMSHLDPKQNWGAEPWREPKVDDNEEVLFSECGRLLDCDYRSHWYVLTKPKNGPVQLLVSHGGGEDRISLDYVIGNNVAKVMASLGSDNRYLLMGALFKVSKDGSDAGAAESAQKYRRAFVEGRLKKRKQPGQNRTKVWIEPKLIASATPKMEFTHADR